MNWYLLFIKPREEGKVERVLSEAGVECYCPKVKKIFPKIRERKTGVEPLFPRYIFVRVSLEEWYHKIKYTRGVVGFVDFGSGPVDIGDGVVANIRGREKDGYIHLVWKAVKFSKNQRVKVKKGLFKDMEAIFEGYLSGDERVSLLLENISSNIKLNISKYFL